MSDSDERIAALEAEVAALREARARDARVLQAVDQAASFMSVVGGPELVFELTNRRYLEVVGKQDLLGKPLREAFPELAGQGIVALLQEVMRTGQPFHGKELPIVLERRGTLETVYFDFVYQPVLGEDGRAMGVISTGLDVTEQVLSKQGVEQVNLEMEHTQRLIASRVEERTRELQVANETLASQSAELASQQAELEASQAVLRGVLDSATSGIVALDAVRDEAGRIVDFRFTLANPTSEKMVLRTAAEMLGNTLLTLFPGNIESGLFDHYVRVTETGTPIEVETHYHDDRLGFWLHVSAVKVGDGVAITFTDITARKHAEGEAVERSRELARRKAFAEGIIENVPTGIGYLDRDLIFRVANPIYCGFLQMKREQIIDRYLVDVVPGGEATIGPIFAAPLDRGEPHRESALPFCYTTPEGTTRLTHWDATYLPMWNADGDAVDGVLVLAHEVSARIENERLQAEQIRVLEQTDRMKDQFLSILSHELRTPINAIMGFGSVLDDGVAGPLTENQRLYTSRILGGAETLLALINDLLDMSRIQAGKFSLEPALIPLPPLAREVLANLTTLAERKSQALTLEVPENLAPVMGDAQRLTQVLVNLIGNAIKFTPERGRISVRLRADAGRLRVEIEDSGMGIAAEDLPRLFKPFTQLDASNTRNASGTGLGLSISKALIEAHGGGIGVSSVLGQGATFWFTLPGEAGALTS